MTQNMINRKALLKEAGCQLQELLTLNRVRILAKKSQGPNLHIDRTWLTP